ncbi:MAG: glycosyltransferase [Ferruginibacter sp.]
MTDRINILFVAFEFPPLGGAGVQRSLKFVKYLPQFDINPIVITVNENDYPSVMPGHAMDYTLTSDIPEGTIIEKFHCKVQPPARNKLHEWIRMYFSVTENFKEYWKEDLLKRLPGIMDKYKPRAIYVSLPPFAMAPLWFDLLKEYELPLIVDFRDAWTQWCIAPNGSYFHYLVKLQQERQILNKAGRVVFSSDQTMKDMIGVHPSVDRGKFSVITNGYDGVIEIADQLFIGDNKKIKIGYVGSFYYEPEAREQLFKPWWKRPPHRMLNYVPRKEDWLYRSPFFFFKTIRSLIDKDPLLKDRIEIHFAGKKPHWLASQIESFGLNEICYHHGYLQHDDVISFQKNCDTLLITSAKVPGGRDFSIAGKTFEYFTIGKPILAFVCEGSQKDVLVETGMSVVCDPDDIHASGELVKKLFDGKLVLQPDKAAIEKYNRRKLTKKLAGLIKELVR